MAIYTKTVKPGPANAKRFGTNLYHVICMINTSCSTNRNPVKLFFKGLYLKNFRQNCMCKVNLGWFHRQLKITTKQRHINNLNLVKTILCVITQSKI